MIPDNFIQLESSREPLLTWKAKVPASHPVDYPVPSFGADPEIEASLKHSEKLNAPADAEPAKYYAGEKFHVDKKFKLFPEPMKYPATEEFTE